VLIQDDRVRDCSMPAKASASSFQTPAVRTVRIQMSSNDSASGSRIARTAAGQVISQVVELAQTVVNNTTVNRVSYNGGTDGVTARPTAAEQAAARVPHQSATTVQVQHRQAAMANHALSASVNHGKPSIAATSKPAELNGPGVVKASAAGSPQKASTTRAAAPAVKPAPVHAADLPPVVHQAVPGTGNVDRDKVNQQQQDALRDTQEKQRQALQQQQAADHEQAAKQPSTSANVKALEQQHQVQTQALAQRHTTEQKTLQETQQNKPEAKGEAAPHT
jgi:hypothetical protein